MLKYKRVEKSPLAYSGMHLENQQEQGLNEKGLNNPSITSNNASFNLNASHQSKNIVKLSSHIGNQIVNQLFITCQKLLDGSYDIVHIRLKTSCLWSGFAVYSLIIAHL